MTMPARNRQSGPGSSGSSPAATGHVEVAGLTKQFGDVRAVDDVDLDIRAGEFFTLLGPSGSGKTTTLMMLAGFTDPTSGTIAIDGRQLAGVAPDKRDIGMVFQNYALFPHLSVRDNLSFPLEMRGVATSERARRIAESLELVQLPAVGDRWTSQLSGGQQQRIAVARAMISNPPVLLMDEPLGALDRNLRAHLQTELRALQQELAVTVVYVTHDQDEAMSMSDRVAVMNAGRIEQVGPPEQLYNQPASLFVATFLGDTNLVTGTSTDDDDAIQLDEGATVACQPHGLPAGTPVTGSLRPERVHLCHADEPGARPATVTGRVFLGSVTTHTVAVDGVGDLEVVAPNDGAMPPRRVGDAVTVAWRPDHLQVFATT